MNNKLILKLSALSIVIMMLFPPYLIVNYGGAIIQTGYCFIFYRPIKGVFFGIVNIELLIAQVAIVFAVSFLLIKSNSNK